MAIAKNPRRKTSETDADRQAAAFISGAGQPATAATDDAVRRPIRFVFPPNC